MCAKCLPWARHAGAGVWILESEAASLCSWTWCLVACSGVSEVMALIPVLQRREPNLSADQQPVQMNAWASVISKSPFRIKDELYYIQFCFVFCLLLFMAASTAHGGSQARGRIGAIAAGLPHSHSNAGSELHLQPTPQLMATPDP